MSLVHLHLLLNHFPIVGTILAAVLLGLALVRRADTGVWLAGTVLLAISAVSAAGANLTGEPAEEAIEDMPGVSEAAIHEHEERADIATVVSVVIGIGAVAAYALGRNRSGIAALAGPFAGAVVSGGLMAWTGAAGGQIHHPEVRDGAPMGEAAEAGEHGEAGERGEAGEHGEAGEAGEAH